MSFSAFRPPRLLTLSAVSDAANSVHVIVEEESQTKAWSQ